MTIDGKALRQWFKQKNIKSHATYNKGMVILELYLNSEKEFNREVREFEANFPAMCDFIIFKYKSKECHNTIKRLKSLTGLSLSHLDLLFGKGLSYHHIVLLIDNLKGIKNLGKTRILEIVQSEEIKLELKRPNASSFNIRSIIKSKLLALPESTLTDHHKDVIISYLTK